LTLNDGTTRSGQVLEVSGSKAVVQVSSIVIDHQLQARPYFNWAFAFLCRSSSTGMTCESHFGHLRILLRPESYPTPRNICDFSFIFLSSNTFQNIALELFFHSHLSFLFSYLLPLFDCKIAGSFSYTIKYLLLRLCIISHRREMTLEQKETYCHENIISYLRTGTGPS